MKKILDVVLSVILLAGVFYVSFFQLKQEATQEVLGVASTEDEVVIAIDPGHGGFDPGKVAVETILEKDINLSIATKLAEELKDAGYRVILTRTEDVSLSKEGDVNRKATDMKNRCEIIENAGADVVISIHQNSFSDSSVKGGQVFYYKHSDRGRKLAEDIQKSFREIVDSSNTREAKSNDNYYMLLNTASPTVIVECGFLSNPDEREMLMNSEYQDKICEAINQGLSAYFNN